METFRKPDAYKSINSNACSISLKQEEQKQEQNQKQEQKIIKGFTTLTITMVCCLLICFNIFLDYYL